MDKQTLKQYFRTGARPTEQQFAQLIDSMVLEDDAVKQETTETLTQAVNAHEERLATLESRHENLATDTANLQTQATEIKDVASNHEERIENAELMADDQWQAIDRLDMRMQILAQQIINHPEAEDLGHLDNLDELDNTLSLTLEAFCAQGVYASYVWNNAYNVRSRQYETDPDTGLPIPTGERIISVATATVGDNNEPALIWIIYSLFDFYHVGGNPTPNSRMTLPLYVATAIRLFNQQLYVGSAPGLGWGDEQPATWTWRPATKQDDILTQIETLRQAIDTLDASQGGGDLTSLIARIAQNETETDNLQHNLAELQTKADTLEQNLSDLDTKATQAVTTLTASINAETTTRQTADNALQEQINAHTVTLGTQEQRLDNAETELNALTQRITDAEEAIEEQNSNTQPAPTAFGDTLHKVIYDNSYLTAERQILDDIRNDSNTLRVWVVELPQDGGTDFWHYRLLSMGSTGLIKMVRTHKEGISLLSAAKTATKFTVTQKLAF